MKNRSRYCIISEIFNLSRKLNVSDLIPDYVAFSHRLSIEYDEVNSIRTETSEESISSEISNTNSHHKSWEYSAKKDKVNFCHQLYHLDRFISMITNSIKIV